MLAIIAAGLVITLLFCGAIFVLEVLGLRSTWIRAVVFFASVFIVGSAMAGQTIPHGLCDPNPHGTISFVCEQQKQIEARRAPCAVEAKKGRAVMVARQKGVTHLDAIESNKNTPVVMINAAYSFYGNADEFALSQFKNCTGDFDAFRSRRR
jgi:hypothetical protein